MIRRGLLAFLAALLFAGPIAAKPPGAKVPPKLLAVSRDPLTAALERAAIHPPSRIPGTSISIAELDSGKVVYEKNPNRPEVLASVTKMLSTAAALHELGPDYKFKTTFWRRGEIKDGLLSGPLLVVGGGDPNISGRFYNDDFNAVFDKWADGLKQAGITRVSGDLIVNAAFFDSMGRHPDWKTEQENKWYQAPTSALSFNDNVVYVSIGPGEQPGRLAAITIEPESGLYHAVTQARTTGQKGRVRLAVTRQPGSDAIEIYGIVPFRRVNWTTPISVDDPPAFFGNSLRKRLETAGIKVLGTLSRQDVKPDASWQLIAQTESDLVPTIAVANKRSQGFYAEQIFKTLAAEKAGQGSWASALELQRKFFASLGLDASHFEIRDGSGLSPQNRVPAADIVAFLRAMHASPVGPIWRTTLASAGEEGSTLHHRMIEEGERVQAKTGSINSVSTLAGYVVANSGKSYAFAILLNGGRVNEFSGHAYQDRLIRALVKNG